MIHVVYSGTCVYDPRQRGFAEANIAYKGQYPVTTALKYIQQLNCQARLYSVAKDGIVYHG